MSLDMAKGALIGLAIGDALGATTEFMRPEEIRRQYGWLSELVGGGWLGLQAGETTDDTAMTLAVAEGIIENPDDPIEAIGRAFIAWKNTNPPDIGNTCRQAFSNYHGDWFEAAELAHKRSGGMSAGNGTLMRCLPVAISYPDGNEMERWTRLQSKMTHYDDLADEACVIYNRIAARVLGGEALLTAMRSELSGTRYEHAIASCPSCDPDGFVVHTMEWVVYLLSTYREYTDVIERAANEGFDSDTVGAIAGGLKGLEVGYQALPRKYVDILREEDRLERTAERLWEVRVRRANKRG
ncbi:MAG: ADP-ribosylglycohydrolase family protein [Alicyclobacillus sp.]|nr:ADP-ribosylglycohydrolase family protein [Alicyclobacillus sp.]